MGVYYNPSNESYTKARNSQIYIDKSGLIDFLNKRLSTEANCIAVSHARRFGKSNAAGMIDAYYSLGCDSSSLFDDTEIAQSADYKKYMNKFNVIHLDISSAWDFHKEDLVEYLHEIICEDLKKVYIDNLDYTKELYWLFHKIYTKSKIPFVIIIDEWDCVIRNSENEALVHQYLQFLHSLFKSEESKAFLALAYITGILPIKKIKDESALNNFREFTMLKSKQITKYFGFTEKEVKELCKKYEMDFDTTKTWYNGYLIDGMHMYNPNSVVQAMVDHDFDTYWKNTSSFESINTFINMNYEGLKDDVLSMIVGERVDVKTGSFVNDMTSFDVKDDVLTLLIHLGYLAYDREFKQVYIPNNEVREEFVTCVSVSDWGEASKALNQSSNLLKAIWQEREEQVAQGIENARKDGKFMSIDDLKIRAKIGVSGAELLKQFGCLEGMSQSNQLSLFG